MEVRSNYNCYLADVLIVSGKGRLERKGTDRGEEDDRNGRERPERKGTTKTEGVGYEYRTERMK